MYFNAVRDFTFNSTGVNNLNSKLSNNGFYPGENSYFMRFMESQDEDRISYVYNSFEKTMPMATVIFTAPGMPMIINGQEVGLGKGIGCRVNRILNDRRRGIIDWNFGGKNFLLRIIKDLHKSVHSSLLFLNIIWIQMAMVRLIVQMNRILTELQRGMESFTLF